MVGSNSLSGLGRFAFCETLESRNLFAAAVLDTAFHNGSTETHFGGNAEVAISGAVLTSGRLIVAGTSELGGSRNVLAVYNRDGYLSSTFDGDGKLVLDVNTSALIGKPLKVFGTPDGGALLFGTVGIAKFLSSGKLDTKFGFLPETKNGIDSYAGNGLTIRDGYLPGDGTFRLLADVKRSGVAYTDIMTFDAVTGEPRTANSFRKLSDQTVFLANGQGAAFVASNGNYSEYGLTSTFTRRAGFGNNGVVDLTSAFQKWINANGPFTLSSGGALDAKGYPALKIEVQQATADGGLQLFGYVQATSAKLSQDPQNAGRTLVFITIDSAGKVTSVGNKLAANGSTVFDGNPNGGAGKIAGTFYTPDGNFYDVVPNNSNAGFTTVLPDSGGKSYVIGSLPPTYSRGGFFVARVLPFSTVPVQTGRVTGFLFNDDNGDGIRQDAETLNASKTVFLDTNDNGVLDSGERYTVTNANGGYTFEGVAAGNYNVRRVLPSGYRVTTTAATKGHSIAVIAGQETNLPIGSTARAVVQGRITFTDKDGNSPVPADGQYVLIDLDRDGFVDPGEPLANAKAGNYRLPAVVAGTYRLSSVAPSGYVFANGSSTLNQEITLKAAELLTFDIVLKAKA